MFENKFNPKKHRIHRRVRNPLPVTRTVSKVKPNGTCKECMIMPRKQGSSRCEKCIQDYHDSTKSDRNT